MPWQRARQPEQIAYRRRQILDAAATAFVADDYDKISLNRIACDAGLTKSNIYRYFECKEEIFLTLFLDQVEDYVHAAEARLAMLEPNGATDLVAEVLSAEAARRPRLAALTALLSGVLERTLSEPVLLRFKLAIVEQEERLSSAIGRVLPALDEAAVAKFVLILQALVAGLWPMANPAPALDHLMEQDAFAPFRIDFAGDLKLAIEAALLGLARIPFSEGTST